MVESDKARARLGRPKRRSAASDCSASRSAYRQYPLCRSDSASRHARCTEVSSNMETEVTAKLRSAIGLLHIVRDTKGEESFFFGCSVNRSQRESARR